MENGLNYISRFPDNFQQGSAANFFNEQSNPELDHKVKKVTEKFSENLNIVSNEPSLAFFRIQEHVRKSMPQLVDKKHEVQEIQQQVQGSCFDMEYAINTVKAMEKSESHFQNIQDLLKNSMFMKQQINYEQARKEQERLRPSMYRSMTRNNTVDIPVSAADRRSADFTHASQLPAPSPASGSPRARSSSMSSARPQRPPPPNANRPKAAEK